MTAASLAPCDGDGDELRGAVDRGGGEGVGQRLPGIERLHGRIGIVERVAPHPGRRQRIGAVAVGACGRRADRSPGIRRVVDVGGVQIAGRDRGPRGAVVDATGLGDRPAGDAGDHGVVVGAVDGDGDQLGGAVDREGGERVGQRLPGIERLHGRVAVVERVGPEAGGGECEAAEAVGAGDRCADRCPGIGCIVDIR